MAERSEINSLPAAVMDFFGKLPNETSAEFLGEYKALTDADKAEFRKDLKARGYNV